MGIGLKDLYQETLCKDYPYIGLGEHRFKKTISPVSLRERPHASLLQHCFSDLTERVNFPGVLLSFWVSFSRSGVSWTFRISGQLPGEADAAGLWTTPGRGLGEGPRNLVTLDFHLDLALRHNGLPFWGLVFLICNMKGLKGMISNSLQL